MNTSTFNPAAAPELCVTPPPAEPQPTPITGHGATWLVTRALCRVVHQQKEQEAVAATQKEIDAAVYNPKEVEKPSMAGARAKWAKENFGPTFVPFELEGETLFVKRFNFGEKLYLSLLMPVDESGLLDVQESDKLAFLAAEVLRLGLRRDEQGTPYFETNIAACHYVDSPDTCVFAATCIEAIQRVTGIFPRNPERVEEANQTRAQKRRERIKSRTKADANTTPPIAPEAILERAKAQGKATH